MHLIRRGTTLLALIALLIPITLSAQSDLTTKNIHDTEPNQPQYYEERVADFRNEEVQAGGIIFLGNSITEGGNWRVLLGDSSIANRGISGDVTSGILRRLDEVIERRPRKLFLLIGINDISKDIPPEIIVDNVRTILERVKDASADTEVFVQSILPLNPAYPGFPQHFDKELQVYRVNRMLREVAVSTGSRFVNLFPVFMDAHERLDERLTYDGLHLNDAGYEVWAEHLLEMGYIE